MLSLTQKVARARVAARDILRMSLINGLLDTRTQLKNELARVEKGGGDLDKALERSIYKRNKLDPEHPDYVEQLKNADADVAYREAEIATHAKNVEKATESYEKALAENKKAIRDIKNGTTKVRLSSLSALAGEIIAAEAAKGIPTDIEDVEDEDEGDETVPADGGFESNPIA